MAREGFVPAAMAAVLALLAGANPIVHAQGPPYPFNNASLPPAERAADLLSRLTLHEKVGMLLMDANMAYGNNSLPKGGDLPSTAVDRLGVPQFNWMSMGSVYRGAANGCVENCCTACPPSEVGGPRDAGGGCCHDGFATQLPQGTGMAATWDAELVFAAGVMASDESWGIQNGMPGGPVVADYRTGASSVINILRDGRWGRAPETYGECPHLTGATAVAYNKGLMGYATLNATTRQYDPYLKVVPTMRHFVAYAGPDSGRFYFDAVVADDDLRLTYLPAWAALVRAGAISGVMSAISALNGIPSAAHRELLTNYLRGEIGFPGFVISDCDTLPAVSDNFHYTASTEQAVAAALRAGGDINCGPEYALLNNATAHGLVSETSDIDPAVLRALTVRVQTGDLDLPGPPAAGPYASIPYSVVNSPAHKALARAIVAASVVLLKNDAGALPFTPAGSSGDPPRFLAHEGWALNCAPDGTCLTGWPTCDNSSVPGQCSFPRASAEQLCAAWPACGGLNCNSARPDCQARAWGPPLTPMPSFTALARINPLRRLLVVGPSANDTTVQAHTYHGTPEVWVTVLTGLTAVLESSGVNVTYVPACTRTSGDKSGFPAALAAVADADAVLYVGGLDQGMEEEDTDRGDYTLPGVQLELIQALYNASYYGNGHSTAGNSGSSSSSSSSSGSGSRGYAVPFAALIISGGPVSEPWMAHSAPGLAWAWVSYFGQAGDGIADVLTGTVSPSGRLPFTMPVDTSQIGPITDYSMRGPPYGRTYRYLQYDTPAALPLFPFGWGLSYANVSVVALALPQPAANVSNSSVPVVATVVNTGPVATDFVVAVYGEFLTCAGQASPVAAAPLRTLLAFTRLRGVQPDGQPLVATMTLDLSTTPAAERQPLPGLLRLWAGDGGPCTGCPSATLQLMLGAATCTGGSGGDEHGEL